MRAIGWVVVIGLGLAGCASAPLPPRTAAFYEAVAGYAVTVQRCAVAGFMDPATAAEGLNQQQEVLDAEAYSLVDYQILVKQVERRMQRPTQEHCTIAAVKIHARAQDQAGNIAYANQVREEQAKMIRSTTPHITNCNHIGNQSLCTGF